MPETVGTVIGVPQTSLTQPPTWTDIVRARALREQPPTGTDLWRSLRRPLVSSAGWALASGATVPLLFHGPLLCGLVVLVWVAVAVFLRGAVREPVRLVVVFVQQRRTYREVGQVRVALAAQDNIKAKVDQVDAQLRAAAAEHPELAGLAAAVDVPGVQVVRILAGCGAAPLARVVVDVDSVQVRWKLGPQTVRTVLADPAGRMGWVAHWQPGRDAGHPPLPAVNPWAS